MLDVGENISCVCRDYGDAPSAGDAKLSQKLAGFKKDSKDPNRTRLVVNFRSFTPKAASFKLRILPKRTRKSKTISYKKISMERRLFKFLVGFSVRMEF